MVFEYKNLGKADRDAVRARINAPEDEPAYENFLTAWEESHVAHRALRDKAVADGDEEEAARQNEAIATLEESITNVRAGKRPDGTSRPTPPAPTPPAPNDPNTPAPTPTDPARPQADEPVAPAPTPRRAAAKKDVE